MIGHELCVTTGASGFLHRVRLKLTYPDFLASYPHRLAIALLLLDLKSISAKDYASDEAASHPLTKRLASTPPSQRHFAVVCPYPACGFIWYFYSDWEAWEAGLQHQHPSVLHIFRYDFVGDQTSSGFTLFKHRWIELLEFRDADLRATS